MSGSRDSIKRTASYCSNYWSLVGCVILLGAIGAIGSRGAELLSLSGDSEKSRVPQRDFTPSIPAVEKLAKGFESLTDRAFWGAPPPMPHSFTKEWDAERCLQCHARETNIAKRQQAISPVPHTHLSQCQQCHVRAANPDAPLFVFSNFIGVGLPGKGSRATPVSPPTIPHQTFMREHCVSCHGPSGEQRIETPHAYRSQCRQCHVSQIDREYSRSGLR